MNDPAQGRVAGWSVEEHLAFDIVLCPAHNAYQRTAAGSYGRRAAGDGKGDCRTPEALWLGVSDEAGCGGAWDKGIDSTQEVLARRQPVNLTDHILAVVKA